MAGATIRIFLVDGTPLGPRTLEKSNWYGRALDFPRVEWPRVKGRPELSRPGVYILRGSDADGLPVVYVGQADELRRRIDQHQAGPSAKGFWTRCVAFHNLSDGFNNAHVRRIEARLIARGHEAKRATIENGNQPIGPTLSEADESEADTFFDEMLVLLPLLDVDAFTLPSVAPSISTPELRLRARGIEASGSETPDGFVVRAGSRAAIDPVRSIPEYARKRREDLVRRSVLVPEGTSLRLTQDYAFESPSTAASVMLGRSANGRAEWKDATGRALKDLQGSTGD